MQNYIKIAKNSIGVKEIKGRVHNTFILKMLSYMGAWWNNDEVPWCGVFVGYCLKKSGYEVPKHWYRAKAYLGIGMSIKEPVYGCLAIFKRKGGGHVGFVVGAWSGTQIDVLGGNQKDQVSVYRYSTKNIVGYRWLGTTEQYCSARTIPLDVVDNLDVEVDEYNIFS